MGGVGKTTLVEELIKRQEMKGLFDKVVMATVSQNPDYEKIQRKIADDLGLQLRRQSLEGRGQEILEKLMEMVDKRVLIVLDDVWKELTFELIGLPSQDHQKCHKILFTSRDQNVCQKMGSQVSFEVSELLDDEAWHLFREMAGRDVVDRPDINPIAREVAKECARLPLAIVTIGRALCNKEKFIWENAVEQLKKYQFLEMQERVYSRIQLSIDILGSEELKSCLFLCGLFPEDFNIPIESLLRYGVGLGLFEATDAIWKVRNQVHYLVNNLKRCFLLLDSEEPRCVKMHDVVRDVVIKISSEQHWILVQSTAEMKRLLKQKQGNWHKMSLILDGEMIGELENGLECPTLELLQVWSQSKVKDLISLPGNLIRRMDKLQVLVMQNLCIPKASISSLSSVFQALINLHTLQLVACDVRDIFLTLIGKHLKKLEILSFAYSNINQLPVEIGNLGLLRLLDLTGCDQLNFISANVLARLSRLEEFYFKVKNFPWLLNKDAVNELGTISQQLKLIEINITKLDILPNELNFEKLQKFWVDVDPCEPYAQPIYFDSNLSTLQLSRMDYSSIKSSLMTKQLVKKCENLLLKNVEGLRNVLYELDDSGLQYVKELYLEDCPNLGCVIDSSSPCCAFPLIKLLDLYNLPELRDILHASDHHEVKKSMIRFSYLEDLTLRFLPNLIGFSNVDVDLNNPGLCFATNVINSENKKDGEILSRSHSEPGGCKDTSISAKLFSPNWMKQFPKLQKLYLIDCSSLHVVFDLEGCSESSGHALDSLFPQLRYIEILYLKNLSYVWWGNVPPYVQGFKKLRSLKISGCDSLRQVFPSAVVSAIINLEKLEVSNCGLIENLVDERDKNKGHVKNIGFNKLYYLTLDRLPKLVSIGSDSFELECPSLRNLEIVECPVLEISLLSTHIHASTKDVYLHSFKENNSRSSTYPHAGCIPFLTKFISQGNTDKKNSKEVSPTPPTQDHVPSRGPMWEGQCHMLTLGDFWVTKCDYLSTLETIKIENHIKLNTIVGRRGGRKDMTNIFTQLNSLHLQNLPNLTSFCFLRSYDSWEKHKDMHEYQGDHERIKGHPFFMDEFLFPNLTYLVMIACDRINSLFSHSSLSSLEHLKDIHVSFCQNMEEIVSSEETETSTHKIRFPGLQILSLCGLPKLKAFCQGPSDLYFPSMEEVKIEDCPNMKVFSQGSSHTDILEDVSIMIKSLSHSTNKKDINATVKEFQTLVASQGSEKFPLTELCKYSATLNVNSFDRLSVLVPLNEIHNFQHVRKLRADGCASLVELFESTEKEDTIATSLIQCQLEDIILCSLPKLSHVWKNNNIKSFQKVTHIDISSCHSLKSLLSCSMAKILVHLQFLSVRNCNMMEQIVTKNDDDTKDGSKIKILFPKLDTLKLHKLPMLKCFCLGDYDYDVSLSCNVGEDNNSNDKVQILFSTLNRLGLSEVPKLTCFCSGAYDYDIMVSLSSIKKYPTFPHGNVTLSTPNLYALEWEWKEVAIFGDLKHNPEKYRDEMRKLETFKGIERDEQLVGYIKRQSYLRIEKCERLKEIFESNDDYYYDYEKQVMRLDSGPNMKHYHFQYLEHLVIVECHELKYVFPDVSIATSLPKLLSLEVYRCEKIEEIIRNPVFIQQQSKIIFPYLVLIKLKELPSLQCFCRSFFPCHAEMPDCRQISIEDCPNMKTFWYNGILFTPQFSNSM